MGHYYFPFEKKYLSKKTSSKSIKDKTNDEKNKKIQILSSSDRFNQFAMVQYRKLFITTKTKQK